jgi:hypothetical protein
MSVSFDAEGTITIAGLAGPPVVLSRPTLGQYRQLRDQYQTAKKQMLERTKQAEKITSDDDDTDEEEAERLLDELQYLLESWHHDFIAAAASLLSSGLPESTDDWPADLALDPIIPGRMLDHWRRVPLARGSNPTS